MIHLKTLALVLVVSAACSSEKTKDPAAKPSESPAAQKAETPATPPPATPAAAAPAAAAPLPAEADIAQGQTYWAVYFAKEADIASAPFVTSTKKLTELGFTPHQKDANCDMPVEGKPAPPATPRGDSHMLLAAYYSSEADARAVATRYGEVVWVGQVATMCLD